MNESRFRLCTVAVALSLLFCMLIVRFYRIQIIEGDKWAKAALAQHQYVATIPAQRGSFYSNTTIKKGHPGSELPFVTDVPKFHLFIDPDSIPEPTKQKMAKELMSHFGIDKEAEFFKKSRSRKVASWLEREERDRIEKWWQEFHRKEKLARNAIYFTSEFRRSHPFGSLLGAVLHTMQEDQVQPTGGLELMLNEYLKGKEGKRLIVHSPKHPIDIGKTLVEPENGADVYLTVNHYIQAIVETELAKGVQSAKALGGWAVLMDPFTGEILALAQYPAFDLSRYNEYFNNPEWTDFTKVKALTDCFEPGSIFKPITVAVCMKANEELAKLGRKPIFTLDEKIPCSNGWFPGRTLPLKDGRPHAFLNMDLAIQKSSNIYVARLIQRLVDTMGEKWYRNALEELFGFGCKTNIDFPAESPGLLPTPGKLHPNGKLEWSLPTPASLSMGHNILCTSLQIARAYAVIANGGFSIRPHLIRKVVKGGKTLIDNTSLSTGKAVLSPSIARAVTRAMRFVVKEGGTSKRGDVPGYTEAGKSGTAEKVIDGYYSKDHNISSFVGFAPATHPRFVLIVSVDDPEKKIIPGVGRHQMGGVSAAPIFRDIATKVLQYLGVTPDDPLSQEWAQEIKELKAKYEQWNQSGSSR